MTEKEKCTGCTACAAVCPFDAITMKADPEGFLYPVTDSARCVKCGKCDRVCPVDRGAAGAPLPNQAFLAMADDARIRRVSSSGGIFTRLSEKILEQGGMVFGCAMSEHPHRAHHVGVSSPEELGMLRGSKYLQSDLENTLKEADRQLKQGRWVLFTGTPCQIAGAKSYLRDREKLLTVDVICHGAPSPMVWSAYLSALEAEYSGRAVSVTFRDKSEGWRKYSLECVFDNGRVYRKNVLEDLYLRGFVENLFLRPSCHQCVFKGGNYQSDLTVGDYWGVERSFPELAKADGVSLLIPHTAKGLEAIRGLEHCRVEEVAFDAALKSNPSYFTPVRPSPFRSRAIRRIAARGTEPVLGKYCGSRLSAKVRRKLAKLICR